MVLRCLKHMKNMKNHEWNLFNRKIKSINGKPVFNAKEKRRNTKFRIIELTLPLKVIL